MITEKNAKVTSVVLATIGAICTVAVTVSGKADKGEIAVKADKQEVEHLRSEFNELSAKRREDFVIQKNILSLLEKMDSRIAEMEKNQRWQVEQEVKRLQWQSFKSEPPTTPASSVNR